MNTQSVISLALATLLTSSLLMGTSIFDILKERNLLIADQIAAIKTAAKDRDLSKEETAKIQALADERQKNEKLIEDYAQSNARAQSRAKKVGNMLLLNPADQKYIPADPDHCALVCSEEYQQSAEFKAAFESMQKKRQLERALRSAQEKKDIPASQAKD